jgi:hypothetical protein
LAEAAIDAFANLASATAVDRAIVATLTEANACLANQLEESAQALKEVKALLKKERSDCKKSHKHELIVSQDWPQEGSNQKRQHGWVPE